MSYVIASYGITVGALVLYAVSLYRERAQQTDEEQRQQR